ncbi:MAG: class I SAM-dependent methyltransferase [Candidatus Nanopelagicales bacterium]|nr:class I SAM-dependent methyltransferase [Candidatus Nanopelagicales bacterium]
MTRVSASGAVHAHAGRSGELWAGYLTQFHAHHPGITERVLTSAWRHDVGTPYAWLRSALPASPGHVLDIACGSAPLRSLLEGAKTYLGIDRSHEELALARELGRGPVALADATCLPIEDSSVDVVICSMAIMLLDPIDVALAEVARVLRPGGTLATIRPVAWPVVPSDLMRGLTVVSGLRHLPEMPQRFGRSRFARMLAEAGLTVTADEGLRFGYPLEEPEHARLAVEALYLPHVKAPRRERAIARLARAARPGAQLPVSIRRTIAVRAA